MTPAEQSFHHNTPDGQYLIRGSYSATALYFLTQPIKTDSGQNWLVANRLRELGSIVNYRPDPEGLRDYLCYGFVPAPRTIFKDIASVPPGMSCRLPPDSDQIDWYYTEKTPQAVQQTITEADFWETLCSLIEKKDSALLLSGGLDSAIIAIAAKTVGAHITAYHAKFRGTNDVTKAMAKHLQMNYHELTISSWDALRWFGDAIQYLDQPLGNPDILLFFLLFKNIHKHGLQTVLTGGGGDQLFGSALMKPMILRELYPEAQYSAEQGYLAGLYKFTDPCSIMSSSLAQQLDTTARIEEPVRQAFVNATAYRFCDQLRWVDLQLKGIQSILPGMESIAKSQTIKLQQPFFQEQLSHLVLNLPEHLKLSGAKEKPLLNRLAKSHDLTVNPQNIKTPTNAWFERGLYPLAAYWLNKNRLQKSGLLNPDMVQQLRQQHAISGDGREPYWGDRLWMLCALECWFASLS